jgi:hypothetical protein
MPILNRSTDAYGMNALNEHWFASLSHAKVVIEA